MIMHIVMWKLKDENKQQNMDKLSAMLMDLKDKIPEIKLIEVGQDVKKLGTNYDIVLVSEFESMEDLQAYQVHEEHKKVAEFISEIRIERACVDYQV